MAISIPLLQQGVHFAVRDMAPTAGGSNRSAGEKYTDGNGPMSDQAALEAAPKAMVATEANLVPAKAENAQEAMGPMPVGAASETAPKAMVAKETILVPAPAKDGQEAMDSKLYTVEAASGAAPKAMEAAGVIHTPTGGAGAHDAMAPKPVDAGGALYDQVEDCVHKASEDDPNHADDIEAAETAVSPKACPDDCDCESCPGNNLKQHFLPTDSMTTTGLE